MAENKGVLVLCETKEGKLAAIATELLGCGRKLADDLGQELAAVLVGSGVSDVAQEAIAYGADKAYVADDAQLKDYQTDAYLAVMEKVVEQAPPQIILMGQTSIGRDLAPTLAFRLKTAAQLGCLELAIDSSSKKLLQTKPVYGGNAQAVFVTDSFPQIATVRAKAMTPLAPDSGRKGDVVKVDAALDPSKIRAKVVEKVAEKVEGI
ncbi:MAG: electron transfer flavoprotein subunit alpha, partial [Dehalococcoidia bacterium]